MAHWSENCRTLAMKYSDLTSLTDLNTIEIGAQEVLFFWLPTHLEKEETARLTSSDQFLDFLKRLPSTAVVCILMSPENAAQLLPTLERALKFQLWVAVKQEPSYHKNNSSALDETHVSLLVMTRYREALRHTKTRIPYTYCPACGKTTKDYGGKKHTYHEYGTLMGDVWRDIRCNPENNIDDLLHRLRDLFGLNPFSDLHLLNMRGCFKSKQIEYPLVIRDEKLEFEWDEEELPPDSQLMNADCLDALASIPDNSIDFCFTDPPYNLEKKYDRWNDALESVEYFAWCDKWLSELCRALKPGRTLAVLNIPLWAVRHFQHLQESMQYQNWIVWDALGFPVRMIMPAHYSILCFSKGPARPLPGLNASPSDTQDASLLPLAENYCVRASCIANRNRMHMTDRAEISDVWSDVHRLKHNSRRVDHPCQLPPLLMRRLFALFTCPGEMVLDCFNGAGTSTLVAQQLGRRFVGIELSQQYHELAMTRHQQLACGIDPFGKDEAVPTAKNSPVRRMTPQKYEVSKKTLQLDVRRIAKQLERLPTREEVASLSAFPLEYFEKYFASWGEVCAAARTTGMSELPPSQRGEKQKVTGDSLFAFEEE